MTRRDLIVGVSGLVGGLLLAQPQPEVEARRAAKPTKTPKGWVPTPTPTATPVPAWSHPGVTIDGEPRVIHLDARFDPTRPVSLWTTLRANAEGGPFFAGVCLIGPDTNHYGQVFFGYRHDLPDDDQYPVAGLMVNEWGHVQPAGVLAWKLDHPNDAHRVGIEYRPAEQRWYAHLDGVAKRSFASPPPSPWVQPAIYTGDVHFNEPGYEARPLHVEVGQMSVYGVRVA